MLDELDRKILAALQVDSSLSMQDLADRVGLSSTPCWRRIQKLESSGYIKRRVALLDADKLNLGVSVFIAVRTNQHNAEWVQRFRKIVVSFPEVVDFYRLSGDVDYLIRAVVSDIRAYDDLYQRLIAKIDLHDVSSMFTMEQIKSTTELPLMNALVKQGRGDIIVGGAFPVALRCRGSEAAAWSVIVRVLRAAPFHDFPLERHVPADRIWRLLRFDGPGRGIMCAKRKNPPVRAGSAAVVSILVHHSKPQAYRPREGSVSSSFESGDTAAYAGRLERAGNRPRIFPY